MFHHTLILIYRNFLSSKSTLIINLIGLSSGLTAALLIFLWVSDEISVDKFHKNDQLIFQVMENQHAPNGITTRDATPIGLAYVLSETMPEVEAAATVTPGGWFPKFIIEHKGARVRNEGKFVGREFFNIFSFELTHGNANKVFTTVKDILLSEKLATMLFGSAENAIGESVQWMLSDIKMECEVSGVFKDVPANSSERFDLLLPIDLLAQIMNMEKNDLQASGPSTILMLKSGTDIHRFNEKITKFMAEQTGVADREFFVTPYSSKYLHGKFENGVQVGTRIVYVKLFSVIGVLVLLVACINFMNLSTAKASKRIKEIGIKKAIGANRKSIMLQYIADSTVISFVSLLIALIAVTLLLPEFNDITGKQLTIVFSAEVFLILIAIVLVTGLVAGSYPAFYLSGFHTATVLKGRMHRATGESWVRKGLVVFQFTLSLIFIVAVIVVYRQISFIQNKNLGLDKENVVYFELEGKASEDHHNFLNVVKQVPGVENASAMVGNILGPAGSPIDLLSGDQTIPVDWLAVSYGVIETLGIKMKDGRSFDESINDRDRVVLNQAAIEKIGLEDPLGQSVQLMGRSLEIVGVTRNFHYTSLYEEVKPLAFVLETERLWNAFIKLKEGHEPETIRRLEVLYKQFNPGFTLEVTFLDQIYQRQYIGERRVAKLSIWFASLTIVVSSLGLFGLAAFTAERRIKEIGIRKVLGATPATIIYILSFDFIKLVLLAAAIGLPFSYYISRQWLQNFAYTIDLSLWLFVGAAALAVVIALITVGSHAMRASLQNPVNCLKDE